MEKGHLHISQSPATISLFWDRSFDRYTQWGLLTRITYTNYLHELLTPISPSFINELLVSWDAQATASMLEDPFFKKELEKDKTYREKYGIKDDYMKRSLQVL